MSDFSLNCILLQQNIYSLSNVCTSLKLLEQSLNNLYTSPFFNKSEYNNILHNLSDIETQIYEERTSISLLQYTLKSIINEYTKTELYITNLEQSSQSISNFTNYSKTPIIKNDDYNFLSWNNILKALKESGYAISDIISFKYDLFELYGDILLSLFSEMDASSTINTFISSYIQTHIHDESVLGILNVLALLTNISDDTINTHLSDNQNAWNNYLKSHPETKFIEDQNSMTDFIFGQQNNLLSSLFFNGDNLNGSYNLCEVIATYNALISLNNDTSHISFPELISYFEKNGAILNGYFGTAPDSVENYFINMGYDTKMLTGADINNLNLAILDSQYQTFILTTYNDKSDIMSQIHTLSITYDNSGYHLHNNYTKQQHTYHSLEEAIYAYHDGNSEPICVLGIR